MEKLLLLSIGAADLSLNLGVVESLSGPITRPWLYASFPLLAVIQCPWFIFHTEHVPTPQGGPFAH